MPILNFVSNTHWHSLFFIIIYGLCFSPKSFAIEEIDLLEAFGIEVFQTDPSRQAALEEQQRIEKEALLPPHILPETLAIDDALDAIDLEIPTEPEWTSIEHEVSLTGLDSQECCLRAIRSTRYEAEALCRAKGHHIWHIESIPVISSQDNGEPISQHKFCLIYHNNITKEALEKATDNNPDQASVPPNYYLCRARSSAKCFNPTGANALFVSQ